MYSRLNYSLALIYFIIYVALLLNKVLNLSSYIFIVALNTFYLIL